MKGQSARAFRTLDLTYIAIFAVLMAVCAWISVPMPKPFVPFTLQTLAVFLALATMGGRRGTYAVVVYLLLGMIGMPVFSGFRGGLDVLLGTTGGYIIGFLASAWVYWLMEYFLGRSLTVKMVSCFLGLCVCYAFGTVWFLFVYAKTSGTVGLLTALGWCVIPFIVPDLCKIVLSILLAARLRPFLK